jgi:hypothetical protein
MPETPAIRLHSEAAGFSIRANANTLKIPTLSERIRISASF